MRAIGYFQAGGEHDSTQAMESRFLAYCDKHMHQLVRTFAGAEADSSNGPPRFQELMDFIRDTRSSFLIVVPDASHLGSDLESVARSIVMLESGGSKVACADEEFPDPFQNAFERLGVKGVSKVRSQRIKESMRERALRGQGLGKPPFGYRNGPQGALTVVPEEARVVELIYRLYTRDGLGLRLIAQHLNERGIATRRGGKWNMVTIRDILRNPVYMGTYTRFGLRLPKSHEAIIPPRTFREAQDETRERRPSGRVVSAEPYLLSGLVYCGACGNKMMGVTRRQVWRRKDGRRARGVYRYYQCQSKNNLSTCEYHTWRASLLEGTVLGHLKYALEARAATDGHNGASSHRAGEAREIWEARVKNAERRFLQAMKRAARGEIGIPTLREYIEELDKTRQGSESTGQAADAAQTLMSWESLDFSAQQKFLMGHIARVIVKDNTVEVVV